MSEITGYKLIVDFRLSLNEDVDFKMEPVVNFRGLNVMVTEKGKLNTKNRCCFYMNICKIHFDFTFEGSQIGKMSISKSGSIATFAYVVENIGILDNKTGF